MSAQTAPQPPPSPELFRLAMGRFATGVTVISTIADGHDHAMTASAITSVSLDPLLVLVCVEIDSRFHDAVTEAGFWGVSMLPTSARATADWLATRGRPLHAQLDRVPFHRGTATGVPLLDHALATIECQTCDVHPAGDHSIVVGQVVSLEIDDDPGDALLTYRSRYGSVT